jgi:hypothetical protein
MSRVGFTFFAFPVIVEKVLFLVIWPHNTEAS